MSLSLLMLCLAFLNCTGKQSQSYSCDITVEKIKISECDTCYYVYVLATIGEPNADSVYLPPYVGEHGDRLDCLPSYIKMKNHKKEINFNKTLGFGFIQKQDKRKKLLLLWQQVSKNYLPVDSFKKDFPKATLSYDLEKDSNKFYMNRILFYRKHGGFERNEHEVISRYRLPADSSTFNFVDSIHFKRTAKSRKLIVMMRNIDPWWDYTYSYATEEESMPFY